MTSKVYTKLFECRGESVQLNKKVEEPIKPEVSAGISSSQVKQSPADDASTVAAQTVAATEQQPGDQRKTSRGEQLNSI